MDKKSINFCRYLVGLLFIISFVNDVVRISSITFLNVLPLIGFILMAVSMFSGVYELLAVGAGVQAIPYLIALVRWLGHLGSKYALTYVIYSILFIVGCALVIYFVFKRQSAVKIGVFITILLLIGRGVSGIPEMSRYAKDIDLTHLYLILIAPLTNLFYNYCLPIILSGLVLVNTPKNRPAKEIPAVKEANTSNSQIDSLVRLKELLDAGAITQEEFDEKKKQILGL